MKISKRQLKRIIREERRRILEEMRSGHHGGMYGNPGNYGDPNQWDVEVEEEPFCPYSYLEKMKSLHPGDYAVDAELPMLGVDPDTGVELTPEQMEQVWQAIEEEEQEQAYANDAQPGESWMGENRRLSKRQLKRIIREEKEKLEEENQDEGNAFTGALAKAKEDDEETFKVGDKTYDVKESRKITKSQLKRIIREEKKRILKEMNIDMPAALTQRRCGK